ncbi:MAG: 4-hydroxy-3-methylbut-2-enyl diphosphate reductase [Candidatus Omnitrophica bacterium CG22_combo_CG10-13_8_21_14_all_43_16]|nr:MAG: 4-hydroxy-3-methylbut-2-enyl diphosphate reductase [Candidatus Omnitrophica bacterium CG22_combo_CG10-13_8_21_14_all_43_16]
MKIKVARCAGFCFGVKRAINIVEGALRGLKDGEKIYSLGALIHNPQVVEELFKKGLRVAARPEKIKSGTVIISSHGAPAEVLEEIKKKKVQLIDATCPFVKYAQNIVRKLKKDGYRIIIVGDSAHPEVRALNSIAGKSKRSKKLGIISQTTQSKVNYIKEIQKILNKDFSEVKIFNTICSDTSKRQSATRGLLKDCDLMIVIGGKNSANTKRLWQICKESGVDSFHIETEPELKKGWFKGKSCIGITSGASTPDSMVKKIIERIRRF